MRPASLAGRLSAETGCSGFATHHHFRHFDIALILEAFRFKESPCAQG
ncbi:Unknown protein sequence [Pseudomonas amygdali pv. lachrymans]|uniref:Uncharacterized protein n=1 Tax=Pseudomonas amygdali pv. lachrymans TaxID=53707 RepID=A0ABR5KXK3_PSEAV|nr:Unknown protein sequence [Pseudomonas amygdali pv. lachrymans]KPC19519.1 Unknown protein sequence [Pseudomonas amygdali pv. lachrymans]